MFKPLFKSVEIYRKILIVSDPDIPPIDIETEILRTTETFLIEIVLTKTVTEIEKGVVSAEIEDLQAEIETDIMTILMIDLVIAEVIHGSRTGRLEFRIIITHRRQIFSKDTRTGTVF